MINTPFLYNIGEHLGFFRHELHLSHPWHLHGRRCPACNNSWSNSVGYEYPLVDLTPLADESDYRSPHSVNADEFNRRRDEIRPLVPAHLPIPPGTSFGPLSGKASGKFGTFGWVMPWTVVIRREAAIALTNHGLNMPMFADISIEYETTDDPPDFVEYQIEPSGYVMNSPKPKCSVCRRPNGKDPRPILIRGETIQSDYDIFRLKDLSTYIIATERFREAVVDLGFTDITFEPIMVAWPN